MAKKSNFIKNLLTTASAVAVIAGGASSAYAANLTTTGNNAVIGAPNTNLSAAFNNGDNVTVANGGHRAITTGANIIFGNANGGLDANGNGGVIFTIAHDVTLAGANNFGTANGGLAGIVINAGTSSFGQDIAGDITINAGTLTVGGDIIAGKGNGNLVATGGTVAGVVNIDGDVTLTNAAIVNQTGTIGRNLDVGGDSQYNGTVGASNVAGTVIINTTNAGINKIHNAANAVTLTKGNLTMNDAAADVTVTAGNLTINDVGQDLLVNGGTVIEAGDVTRNVNVNAGKITEVGNIAGKLEVVNGGLVAQAGNVGGVVTINTANVAMNTIGNTTGGAVTVTAGRLTMGNHTHVSNVTLTNGELIVGTIAQDLIVNGGTVIKAGDVTRNVNVNAGKITEVGNIAGKLEVVNGGLVAQAGNVGGVVTINTANVAMNTIGNAANTVTLTLGNLTMNNANADVTVDNNANNVLVINDIINGANLIANGGQTTVHNIANDATLDNGAIVNVSGNIGGKLIVANGNKGFVKFSGEGAVTGAVGANHAITKITVEDTTTFNDVLFKAGELNFAKTGAKAVFTNTVDFTAANMAKVTLSKGSKDNIIQINKNAPITIEGEINKDGDVNALTFVYDNAAGQKTLTVDTANFAASVKSNNNKVLDLNFGAKTTGKVGNLGGRINSLNNVTFTSNHEVSVGDIYAANIVINDAAQANFRGIVSSDSLKLGNAVNGGAVARFAAGAVISSPITTNAAGKNIAHFEGGVEINKPITNLERVIFSDTDDSAALLNANITVGEVLAQETLLFANNNNVTISSATTAKSVGAAAGKTLIFNNNGVAGVSALKLEGDVSIATEISNVSGQLLNGKVVIEAGSPLDIQGVTAGKIFYEDTESGVVELGTKITVVENKGVSTNLSEKFTDLSAFRMTENNAIVKWVAGVDQNSIYLTAESDLEKATENLTRVGANATDISNFIALSKDPGFGPEIQGMDAKSQKELFDRVDPTDATAVVSDITTGISAGLGSRISNLVAGQSSSVQNKVVASNGTTGLSSGDDEARYGVWISPFFNQSVQKSNKGSAGYTASTGGGSFGFDTKANDDMVVGLALSMIHSDVKYKNYKSGDKNKINSAMFSVYGMQQITDNWFAQALITVGTNKVTTNEKRKTGNTTYQNATGSYNSMSFSGEALVGYNYSMNDFSITPMGGLRLTRVNDDGYTETGTTNQNLSITKKALSKAEIVVGTRVSGPAYDLNGVSVTPEVHGFLNQDMVGKNAKVNIKTSNGVQIADKSSKPNKTSFNVGAGLDAKYSYMEYGIAYDANISKKFMSNQGTIKVRLNF